MIHSARLVAGAVAIAAWSLIGCYGSVEPVGYADVTSGPVEIETYPSVVYEGRPVYFYQDHWWYRDGRRWAYYGREPPELHRQRAYVRHVEHGRDYHEHR